MTPESRIQSGKTSKKEKNRNVHTAHHGTPPTCYDIPGTTGRKMGSEMFRSGAPFCREYPVFFSTYRRHAVRLAAPHAFLCAPHLFSPCIETKQLCRGSFFAARPGNFRFCLGLFRCTCQTIFFLRAFGAGAKKKKGFSRVDFALLLDAHKLSMLTHTRYDV